MLYNYLKVAIRNLKRNALFSSINIIGLALSMSVCLIALSVIRNAFTYDSFHPYPQRTYRIVTEVTGNEGGPQRWATAPLPLAQHLRGNYSFVENITTVYTAISSEMSYGEKAIGVEGAFADPAFFNVFGFELLYGDKITALAKPNSIVMTEETAGLFFKAGENPVGKIISLKQFGGAFIVTGVIKSTQQKTHLSQKVYVSMSTVPALEAEKKLEPLMASWKNYESASIYLLVKENTSEKAVQQALTGIASATFKQHQPQNIVQPGYDLQRLDHITPGEELINGGNTVSRTTLLGIGGITLLILLMACFNYTNLSLARMLTRSKEVGIRKVIGGSRLQVFLQFITEAVLVALISLVLAWILLNMLSKIPSIGQEIPDNSKDLLLYGIFVLFALCTGLVAGSLPAWILSAFRPLQVIKNLSSVKIFRRLGIQKTLIVIQFTVSIVFVILLVTIHEQSRFMSSFSYGFNEKNIINILMPEQNGEVLKEELANLAGVENISSTSALMGFQPADFTMAKKDLQKDAIGMDNYFVDENYLSLLNLQLIAGTNFQGSDALKRSSVIINEKTISALQFKDASDAIGKTLFVNDSVQLVIAGVVKDFNYLSPKFSIGNLGLRYDPSKAGYLSLKINPGHSASTLAGIETVFKKVNPDATLNYTWFEKELKVQRSRSEEFSIIGFLTIMAIVIACLGLLGIATYTSKVREKEVSIRKVMGADVRTVVVLLSKDLVLLLLIAGIIALPIGYFLSSSFLMEFAHRIPVDWKILSISLLMVVVLGLTTVISQTLRVAIANPVKSLRSE